MPKDDENNKLVQRTFDLCINCQKLGFAKFENLIALAKPYVKRRN